MTVASNSYLKHPQVLFHLGKAIEMLNSFRLNYENFVTVIPWNKGEDENWDFILFNIYLHTKLITVLRL